LMPNDLQTTTNEDTQLGSLNYLVTKLPITNNS
jgi:hypothetical protein